MLKRLLSSILSLSAIAIACSDSSLSRSPSTSGGETAVSSIHGVSMQRVTLLAREEKNLPPGARPDRDREIGFASVFTYLANETEQPIEVMIQNIEVRNVQNQQVQLQLDTPQRIRLEPLEHSENVFQLTNKIGYSRQDQVQAIVTYQIGDRVEVVESEPVEIDRL